MERPKGSDKGMKVLWCEDLSIFEQVLQRVMQCQLKDLVYSFSGQWITCPSCVEANDITHPWQCSHSCALAIHERYRQDFVSTKVEFLEYKVRDSLRVTDLLREELHDKMGWAIVARI